MKNNKRRAERLANEAAKELATVGSSVGANVGAGVAAVGPTVRELWDRGSSYASPRIEHARDWAAPRLEAARERGVELAAPRIEAAAGKIAPAVDATRDKIVDDVLPKVVNAAQSAAARVTEARDERLIGAAAVLSGKAVAKTKKSRRGRLGRIFLVISALGALGAAVFVVLRRRSTDVDPWAQPYPTYPPTGGDTSSPGVVGDDTDEQQPETDALDVVTGDSTDRTQDARSN